MFDGCTGTDLPLEYQVQMEHQCMVSTATERVLFMASEWTQNRETGEWVLVEERHCCCTPNPKLRAEIVAGWGLLQGRGRLRPHQRGEGRYTRAQAAAGTARAAHRRPRRNHGEQPGRIPDHRHCADQQHQHGAGNGSAFRRRRR